MYISIIIKFRIGYMLKMSEYWKMVLTRYLTCPEWRHVQPGGQACVSYGAGIAL